mmetsp:Transcript_76740/g.120891  ORF Transcript_76740/g.120891 Transcript_76740/m.120891 type:complete len:171 (+) Transcript_76740:154-666(+)
MADKVKHDEVEMTPQPYPSQQGNFPAQPGDLQHQGPQQPYNAQPGYPGPQPFTGQPMGYPQPYPVTQQSSTTVVMQPSPTVILPMTPRPQNWLVLSILTCLFCAWPIGLAAIVFSSMVDSAYDGGDYEGARRNSRIAMWLNIASILCGVGAIVFIIIYFTAIVASYSGTY